VLVLNSMACVPGNGKIGSSLRNDDGSKCGISDARQGRSQYAVWMG
jgi:hypothetical protein